MKVFESIRINLCPLLRLKKTLLFFYILFSFSSLFSQNVIVDSLNSKISSYKFYDDFSGFCSKKIDTVLLHYQIYNYAFSNFALNPYIGNNGSAVYPMLNPYNINSYDLIFNQSIRYLYYLPEDASYFQTKSPFTNITYFTSGPKNRQEQNLFVTHTQNVNKKLNVGFLARLNYSDGQFPNQLIKGSSYRIFSSYNGPRYRFNLNINFNTLKSNENGGITEDSLIENPQIPAKTMDVNLQSASSVNKNASLLFQQRLYLTGRYKNNDSVKTSSIWNEAVSVIHRLNYQKSSRTFSDNLNSTEINSSIDRNFYTNIFKDSSLTDDWVKFRRLENNFMLALNAYPLLKIPAELRFGLKNQLDKASYNILDSFLIDTVMNYNYSESHTYINSALIGSLANRFSKTITWGVSAELYFTGYKTSNLYISGDLTKTIRNNFVMSLSGNFSLEKPSYFIQNFESNHFKWHNSFDARQSTTLLKASLSHSKLKIFLEGESGSYINYIYFDSLAKPEIADEPLTMYRINLKKYFNWSVLHTMFRISLQQTTNAKAMPMPVFSGFNTSFVELFIFKRVMQFQLGYDLFYNSPYYANAYSPATGIFYSQNQVKIGNFPFTDVFLNIKIKRARLSLKYENITSLFDIPGKFYAPHYPFNPGILKIGISWNFYD